MLLQQVTTRRSAWDIAVTGGQPLEYAFVGILNGGWLHHNDNPVSGLWENVAVFTGPGFDLRPNPFSIDLK